MSVLERAEMSIDEISGRLSDLLSEALTVLTKDGYTQAARQRVGVELCDFVNHEVGRCGEEGMTFVVLEFFSRYVGNCYASMQVPDSLAVFDTARVARSLGALLRQPVMAARGSRMVFGAVEEGEIQMLSALVRYGDILHRLEERDPYFVVTGRGIEAMTGGEGVGNIEEIGEALAHLLDVLEYGGESA